MFLFTSDNLRLFYRTYGPEDGEPVLLLHGLGANYEMWQPQVMNYVSCGLRIIVPDLRGHGKSTEPQMFGIEDCARDLRDLLDELGLARASLVGVSMGGLVAQQYAVDYPGRIARLIIADSYSGMGKVQERVMGWLASVALKSLSLERQAKILVSTYEKLGVPEVGVYFERQLQETPALILRQARQAVNDFDLTNRLGEIQTPTLVLVGDAFGEMAVQMAQRTAEAIPGARFKVLQGGGDPSNLLAPAEFDQEVLGFLGFD